MEAKMTSKKDKEKQATSQDIDDMDQTTTINPLDHLLQEKRIKRCAYMCIDVYRCGKQHCSDECNEYPNLQSGKSKAKGFCFICLRKGHLLRECNSTRA